MDENAPATKKDIRDLESGLLAKMAEQEERLSEQIRDMQTELLKAFMPWQDQIRFQFRELEVNTGNSVSAIKERMNILERRLLEIERKLLLEPPAASSLRSPHQGAYYDPRLLERR